MSGICGIYGKGDVEEMTRILSHRGPDDLGFYLEGPLQMGCHRLAVFDIGGGHQPMSNEDQSLWAVLDGEVFNFEDIRAELAKSGHVFRSNTDTEVVVHAWEEWGESCLCRFNGQFGIGVWDGKVLYLARDRLGEKPLYYYQRGGRLLFASEIKSLLTQVSPIPRFTDEFRDFESLVLGDTLFQNVRELMPGHILRFDGSELEVERWWELPVFDGPYRSEESYADELRWLLDDSVRLRMKGDVGVGVLLSGGIDSAILCCLARPEHAFTITFRDQGSVYDELSDARMIAKKSKSRLHVVRPKASDLREMLPGMIWHQDFPVGSMSSVAVFLACREASKHVKALLSGQGADELFGGHVRYLMMLAEERLGSEPAFSNYLPLARYFWSPEMFSDPPDRYYTLINRGPGVDPKCRGHVRRMFSRHSHLVDKMGYSDLNLALPTVLHMDDRASAAFGLENRNPFLDHRIVEFAFRLPPELKIDGFTTKSILRKAVRGLAPERVISRTDKMGLVVPVLTWFKKGLKRWSDVRIKRFKERYETNFLDAAWEAAGDRGEFDRKDYMRVCLEVWMEVMIKGEAGGPDDLRLQRRS